jgi:ubiquinone/menaquinone biosynthesis C-methylase UbiE
VEDYVRYRPGYPAGVLDVLRSETGLTPAAVVADVGCGTGLSATLFLRNGNPVSGVEPNREMREAASRLLAAYPRFTAVAGTAEATGLPDRSVDYVVAGQAFHWFDPDAACREFARVLRPGGWVVLMWNTRRTDSPFLRTYEALLKRYGTDYRAVRHENVGPEALGRFFGPGGYAWRVLANGQRLDRAGLAGRLLSSSYTPGPGHPDHEPMLRDLDRLFDEFQRDGQVQLEYDTELYFGRLTGS